MTVATLIPDPGVALGSNLDAAPHMIPEGQGRYVQDAILDIPGVARQRGPINGLNTGTNPNFPSLPTNSRIIGMTTLADPNGTDSFRLLLLTVNKNTFAVEARIYGRGSSPVNPTMNARNFFDLPEPLSMSPQFEGDGFLYIDGRRSAFSTLGALLATVTISGMSISNSDADPYFQASLALDGGALIGMGINFGADANTAHRAMFHWRGAAKADYSMGGAVTIAGTQSSPAIVGVGTTFTTSVEPGMFLLAADGRCMGVVKSITDNTHLTLEQNLVNPTFAARNTDKFSSLRRPYSNALNHISAGTITASTSSATVNGGGTKFLDQGVGGGLILYRASDNAYVGAVSGVPASNTQLTLTANAAVPMNSEDYFLACGPQWAVGKEPVFSTYFNGMQLLANADNNRGGLNERSRIFVTDAKNLEAIDLTKTGSFYDLPSTKPHTDIRGMFSTESAALVFLAEATYGLYGSTPDALVPRVIHSDGLLSPMSIQPWQGGAVWAGFRSLYWFDGNSVQDLLEGRASSAHQKALAGLDYARLRCWSMLHNGHYVCFLSSVNSGIYTHTQGRQNITTPGAQVTDPTTLVYSINLRTGAIGFWTNVNVRGYTAPPGKLVSTRDAYYVVESSQTNGPVICSAESLFQEAGTTGFTSDQFLANPVATTDFAPHFYVEGKLNSFGDPERLKRAQMLLTQYSLYGASDTSKLGIDIVTDMGEVTKAVSPKARTATSVASPISWTNKRARFSKKATLIGVRYYTMADGQPTAARIGPHSVGFKPMRPGRV